QRGPRLTAFDGLGRPVRLGARLGRGGEGAVYEVADAPSVAAKLYYRPPSDEHAAKLQAMVELRTERLGRLSAWPLATLHERPGGPVTGLLMPRVDGKPIHLLYGPKSRLRAFPGAHWAFLLHAATNLARAFAVVHEHGHVVGDVNHGNVLVTREATVALIDCDSFQVAQGDRTFLCRVGVATHLAPELQGDLTMRRSPNHDAFGLAVLLFQLLFLGRHPFSGRYLGSGDLPLERAIAGLHFAYGSAAATGLLRPPPHAPRLTSASPAVALLFERAFDRAGTRGGRPTAREWVAALDAVARALATCAKNPTHQFPRDLPACPWCALETATGLRFFLPQVLPTAPLPLPRTPFDLDAVWARVTAAADAGRRASLLPTLPKAVPSPFALRIGRQRQLSTLVALLGLTGLALLLHRLSDYALSIFFIAAYGFVRFPRFFGPEAVERVLRTLSRREVAERQWQLRSAQTRLDTLEWQWQREASDRAFAFRLQDLERCRRAYVELEATERERLAEAAAGTRERQLHAFLDRHRLDAAKLPGLDARECATLAAYTVETAADVSPFALGLVPGLDPEAREQLLAWRAAVAARFTLDKTQGLDAEERAHIAHLFATQRGEL
ncbi:MAG TPA: hypothetical protein VGE98_12890, partial [Thermoanaerobaculia bacterium]